MRHFNAMVEQCRDRVYSLAYYSLGSREEAEDVTQEVLLRLWRHWPRLDPDRAMGWVIRVTRNACLDVHRQRQTRRKVLTDESNEDALDNHSSARHNPDGDLERHDFQRQVERALRAIDEPYRTILILREIEDRPYAEIAAALTMPLNTVKVYLHRGRRMLREQFHGETIDATL